MPRRLPKYARAYAYKYVKLRDGEKCQGCGGCPPGVPLEIDHIDGNPLNDDLENFRFLCKKCNVTAYNAGRHAIPIPKNLSALDSSDRERGRDKKSRRTEIAREFLDYSSGAMEAKANALYEVPYREWLGECLRNFGFISKREAINSGAEAVGCSTQTSARYLAKLTSAVGPYEERSDALGETVIVPRERDEDLKKQKER